jgi:hypothetical protein
LVLYGIGLQNYLGSLPSCVFKLTDLTQYLIYSIYVSPP